MKKINLILILGLSALPFRTYTYDFSWIGEAVEANIKSQSVSMIMKGILWRKLNDFEAPERYWKEFIMNLDPSVRHFAKIEAQWLTDYMSNTDLMRGCIPGAPLLCIKEIFNKLSSKLSNHVDLTLAQKIFNTVTHIVLFQVDPMPAPVPSGWLRRACNVLTEPVCNTVCNTSSTSSMLT